MLREAESLALHLIRGLYDAAEGRPKQWRSLDDLDVPQTVEAVRYATTRGWIQVESGNSVCLTDAGWRLPNCCRPITMRDEPLRQDADFDRDLWRGYARRDLQEAFRALEDGRMTFGSWERLFLSAAIDHFRYRNFSSRRCLHSASLMSIKNSHSLGALAKRKASRIFALNTKNSHEWSEDTQARLDSSNAVFCALCLLSHSHH